MKKMRTLVAVVAILALSTAVFAAPKNDHPNKANSPNTTTIDGAVWGPNSAVATQPGNSGHSNQNNASAQGVSHQTLVDYLKTLAKGLSLVVDGAVWG